MQLILLINPHSPCLGAIPTCRYGVGSWAEIQRSFGFEASRTQACAFLAIITPVLLIAEIMVCFLIGYVWLLLMQTLTGIM